MTKERCGPPPAIFPGSSANREQDRDQRDDGLVIICLRIFLIRCIAKMSARSSTARGRVRSCPFLTTARNPSHISSLAFWPQVTSLGGWLGLRGCEELSKWAITLTTDPFGTGIGFW